MKKRSTTTATLSIDSQNLQITTKHYVIQDKTQTLSSEETFQLPLQEVTEEKLLDLRARKESGLIIKIEDTCFFTSVPKKLRLTSSGILDKKDKHICTDCPYFSPRPNHVGGCEKVFDATSPIVYLRLGFTEEEALLQTKRIEKYNFISLGFELFNTHTEFLVVVSCCRYENAKS